MRNLTSMSIIFPLLILAACVPADHFHTPASHIKSYRDVPGITKEEIAAIEAVKASRDSLVYGHLLEMETFKLPDGRFMGFTVELFNFLSDFFGIEFVPRYFEEPGELKREFDSGAVDFIRGIVYTAEHLSQYHLSSPITGRRMSVFTRADAADINHINDFTNLKAGFLENTMT
ncbi:MAG: transporter substrate-binding domain-containing protein, partial [Chitinispirillales bacterium]|nr:transporter substrate-binding domain-containing protein [Chitinispirillales bacterium]